MSRPRISVIVPTYNRRALLAQTLESLRKQSQKSEEYEILVVVDGSMDGTLEMLRDHSEDPRIRVVSQSNLGLAAARNRGVSQARGRVVLFLDDDMVAEEDLVAIHLEEHADGAERVVFGHLALADAIRRSFLKQGVEGWMRELSQSLSTPGHHFRFDECHFGHASITRSLILRAGGFDESFVRYGNEDYELGWRLLQMKVEMRFSPRARARQIYDKTLQGWLRDLYWVGAADVALARKHPPLSKYLRLSREDGSAIRRLARRSGRQAIDPLGLAWHLLALLLEGAERLGVPGAPLRRGQYWLGERSYWQGVRDARNRLGPEEIQVQPSHGRAS